MEVTMFEIDPVKYGVLWQKVESYESKFDDMSKKMDKMLTLKKIVVFMINKIKVILTRNFSEEKKESTQEQNNWWANATEIFQTYKSFYLHIYSL